MSAKDKTEGVMRDIHILFSKAEPFESSKRMVVVDKMQMINLLKALSECIYEMNEEYELTIESRTKAQLQLKRENDERIQQSKNNAEDIYAASMMYSDRSLSEIVDIIKESDERIKEIEKERHKKIKKEIKTIRSNQFELKGQLQDLADTQKYLRLIEEENIRRSKAKDEETEVEADPSPTADVQVEIKVNEEYFKEQGYEDLLETEDSTEEEQKVEPEINVNLDAEYFKWKNNEGQNTEAENAEGNTEKSSKKGGIFGFGKKNS